MFNDTVFLFARANLWDAPPALQQKLAGTFLTLLGDFDGITPRLLFYTDGVRLVCECSPVLDQLHILEDRGTELIICRTCLEYLGLRDQVRVGIVGGMGDIIESLAQTEQVISL